MRVQSLIGSLAILIFWSNDFASRAIRILTENFHIFFVAIGISKNINNVLDSERECIVVTSYLSIEIQNFYLKTVLKIVS